jgi:ParB-like chromosome segregation protein Spo0J
MAGADLRRLDALLHLRDALIRFRGTTSNIASQLRIRIEHAESVLARQKSHLQAEIATQRAILSESKDDEERDYAQRALDEAYEQLAAVRERSRFLVAAVARYNRVVDSWHHAMDERVPGAAAFLVGKHAEAVNYQRVAFSVDHSGYSSGVNKHLAPAGRVDTPLSTDPANANSPDELPRLLAGFSWIPITQFAQSALPTKDDFKKVRYEEMTAGLQRLWKELIPLLNSTAHPNRSVCERFDEANGRVDRMGFVHLESLASLWDWFFNPRSKEHIRVTFDNRTGKWDIDNGRHRIKAASDLGWKFVPGEVVQYSSGTKDGQGQAEPGNSRG